jgi:hypothetical protein
MQDAEMTHAEITPKTLDTTDPHTIRRFIMAQARVAFSKINRNAGLDIEDFVSIGLEVYEVACKTWDANKRTKFNTYFTLLLQNKFYKVMRGTHAEKRGGGGDKKKPMAKIVSMDEWMEEHPEKAMPGFTDQTAEYHILVDQIGKRIPSDLLRVYKQMVDPDEALLEIVAKRAGYQDKNTGEIVEGEGRCTLDTKTVAEYLGMELTEFRNAKRKVQALVAVQMGRK